MHAGLESLAVPGPGAREAADLGCRNNPKMGTHKSYQLGL